MSCYDHFNGTVDVKIYTVYISHSPQQFSVDYITFPFQFPSQSVYTRVTNTKTMEVKKKRWSAAGILHRIKK